jgi:hypothetical protein
VGEARKGLRDPKTLAGEWERLGEPREVYDVTAGPGIMQQAEEPEQTHQH